LFESPEETQIKLDSKAEDQSVYIRNESIVTSSFSLEELANLIRSDF